MNVHLLTYLALDAAVVVAGFLIMWRVCVGIRDVTMVDSLWALGMVLVALTAFAQAGESTPRRLLLTGLCAVWGLRLGGYLLWRWRDHGPDRRYVTMFARAKADRGWGFAEASLRLVFALQAPLLFIVCLPVQLGQFSAEPRALGPLAWAGAALAAVGIVFETVGDWQLVRHRKDPAKAGQVLQSGLWRYTRHPNYFGDACVWWGLYMIAAETPVGLWALPGPVFLTWTLLKWSGAPTVEGRMKKTRPDYARYVATTSGFVPWFPKKA
jgi:steroid 5-alpha reductase family enzyme